MFDRAWSTTDEQISLAHNVLYDLPDMTSRSTSAIKRKKPIEHSRRVIMKRILLMIV